MDDTHVSTSDDSVITLDNSKQPNWLLDKEENVKVNIIPAYERQNHIRKRSAGENYSNSQPNTPLLYNSSYSYFNHRDKNDIIKRVYKTNSLTTTSPLPASSMSTTNIRLKSKWKNTSFYFNPSGRIVYSWCGVISIIFMYHLWVIIYRFAFNEINQHTVIFWLTLDYFADLLYIIDMTISIRTGFLEDGVMQFDGMKMRSHYLNSSRFYIDCLSLLPLDFLYLSIGFKSILRIFRLCKVYKFWQFMDRAERHANYPNLMRSTKLLLYYLTFLHWNACIFQLFNSTAESVFMTTMTLSSTPGTITTGISSSKSTDLSTRSHGYHNTSSSNNHTTNGTHSTSQSGHHSNFTDSIINNNPLLQTGNHSLAGLNTGGTFFNSTASATIVTIAYANSNMVSMTPTMSSTSHLFREIHPLSDSHGDYVYLHAFYWSMLSLFPVGGFPTPNCPVAYFYLICEGVIGMFLMATVLGHVSNIVTNVSTAQKEFQARLDSVKNYMTLRRVPTALQERVINWFDFLWYTNKITDEEKVLQNLPYKLKAEIAIHVHLNTLKQVEIFQDTEEGFLSELVLKLRVVLFAPGDYVCRKGEIGKQMYIVNRGKLHVLGDDGQTVLATLHAGSYFGELSILNLGNNGNRRTASVRSLGYSDLFCLSKSDLWEVLKEYPNARSKLEADAYKKMNQYQNVPQQNVKDFSVKSIPYDRRILNSSDQTSSPGYFPAGFENNHPCNVNPTCSQTNHSLLCMNLNHDCLLRVSNSDGSDGYGSDPSRCSAFLPTPQRSPTPPAILGNNIPDKSIMTSNHETFALPNFTSSSITNHSQSVFSGIYQNRSSSAPTTISNISINFIPCHSNENQLALSTTVSESHQYSWLKSCPSNSILPGKQRNLSMPTDLFHMAKNSFHSNSNQLQNPSTKFTRNALHNFSLNLSKGLESENTLQKYCHSEYPIKERHTTLLNSNESNFDSALNGQRVIPVICFEKASTPSISEATISEDEQEYATNEEQCTQQPSPIPIKVPPLTTSSPISLPTFGKNCSHLKIPKHKTSNWIAKRPPWPYRACSHHYKPVSVLKTGHISYRPTEDNIPSTSMINCQSNKNSQELVEHLNNLAYRINKLENENLFLQNCLFNQPTSVQTQQQLQLPSLLSQQQRISTINLSRKHSLPVRSSNVYQNCRSYLTTPTTSPSIVINETSTSGYGNLKDPKPQNSQLVILKRREENLEEEEHLLDKQNNNNSPIFTLD